MEANAVSLAPIQSPELGGREEPEMGIGIPFQLDHAIMLEELHGESGVICKDWT